MYYGLHVDILVCVGGGAFVHLLSTSTRGGGCEISTLVHSRGEGVEIGQNLVHVVVECPLIDKSLKKINFRIFY